MIGIDKCLGTFAVAQTILATLRASSRVLYVHRHGGRYFGKMEGPLIEPPRPVRAANGTTASAASSSSIDLWDLSVAFRQAVLLALDQGDDEYSGLYDVTYEINEMVFPDAKLVAPMKNKDNVDSMLQQYPGVEEIDDEIEALMWRAGGGPGATRPMVAPVTKSKEEEDVGASETNVDEEEEDDDENYYSEENIDPLESDFYLTLSSVTVIGEEDVDEKVPNNSTTKKKQHRRVAQLTAYAPEGFAELRSLFGISEAAFRRSVLESGPFVSFSSNSKGAARAGGVFFFTQDGAYLIKTIKQDEVPALLGMLPRYHRFMQRSAKRSLLTRYCGMYEVTFRDEEGGKGKPYTFVVMNSVFPVEASKSLSERFDLKGSTVGRECTIEERESKGRKAVLQDLDLAREVELVHTLQHKGRYPKAQGHGINIGSSAKSDLMTQLRKDVNFLVACGVMDYSLLVGVEKRKATHAGGGFDASDLRLIDQGRTGQLQLALMSKDNPAAALVAQFVNPVRTVLGPPLLLASRVLAFLDNPYHGPTETAVDTGPLSHIPGKRLGSPATYYFGVIDFLQPYNARKALEYRLKSVAYEKSSFSCVPPKEYGERFLRFLDEHIV